MKTLKLEVGKTYRSRNGEEVKIVRDDGKGGSIYQGSNGIWYTESGIWSYGSKENPEDLIEELSESRHTFSIPDGVKKVTVEQVGNRIIVEMVPEGAPKPGDVMINKWGSVYIFKEAEGNNIQKYYACLGRDGRVAYSSVAFTGRPATTEEVQPLWDALKKAGKRWNPHTMVVEEEITEKEQIEKFLEGYADGMPWSHNRLRWLIEAYLKHKEGEK